MRGEHNNNFNVIFYLQVTSCSWNSDQNLLATCSQDKVVQLWSISQHSVELHSTFSCITRCCLLVSVVSSPERLMAVMCLVLELDIIVDCLTIVL